MVAVLADLTGPSQGCVATTCKSEIPAAHEAAFLMGKSPYALGITNVGAIAHDQSQQRPSAASFGSDDSEQRIAGDG